MAQDIVPALLEEIQRAFEKALETDRRYLRITNRIRDGTATLDDVHALSVITGEALSGALLEFMTPEVMPGGVYYWNIVERILTATLRGNYGMINDAAQQVQRAIDRAVGIGLNPVIAPYPIDRARGLIDKIVSDPINPARWFGEPIVNISESFSDDYMRENARASARAGLESKIVRKLGAFEIRRAAPPPGTRQKPRAYEIPCDWCQSLAGTYVYGEHPDAVFQRHESCRCTVTFTRGRLQQDTHTKRWYTDTGMSLRNPRLDPAEYRRTPREAAEFDAAMREEQRRAQKEARARAIANYARENNVSHRRAANRITRGLTN